MDLRKAWTVDEKTFAAGHSFIAIRQSNLAGGLKDLWGSWMLRKALASEKKTHAPGHSAIAIREWNLAGV